jgi:Uma2 family endonuclease
MKVLQSQRKYSVADFLTLPNATQFELVEGNLVERSVSVLASLVEGIIFGKVFSHCQTQDLALVWPGTNGIRCFPDDPNKVRRPDVSLVLKERFLPAFLKEGFLSIAPDLAVEVLSAHDLAYEIDEKVEEYLLAGIPLVWVIDPEARIVFIHRKDGSTTKLRAYDELTGEDIVPGFRCLVSDLFPSGEK